MSRASGANGASGANVGTGGIGSANYSFLSQSDNPTGFTNNWLESRKETHFFSQNYSDFPLYSEPRKGPNAYSEQYNDIYRDIVKTEVERNPVSDFFFSHKNMKHLKWLICETVRKRSGGLYNITAEAQSDSALLEVMRSMYLNYGKHLPDQLKEQIAELNYMVVVDMVPRTISAIQLYLSYERDHSQQPLPLDRPQNMSQSGTRSNQMAPFI